MELEVGCNDIIQKPLPQKSKDLGSVTLPITIGRFNSGQGIVEPWSKYQFDALVHVKENKRCESSTNKNDTPIG